MLGVSIEKLGVLLQRRIQAERLFQDRIDVHRGVLRFDDGGPGVDRSIFFTNDALSSSDLRRSILLSRILSANAICSTDSLSTPSGLIASRWADRCAASDNSEDGV